MTFSIAGVPVHVEHVFWIVAVVLGFSRITAPELLASWVVVVFVSILVHELGHAAAFRAYGHRPSIELHAMGGHTRGTPGRRLGSGQDIVVSLAGPVFGFIAGSIVFALEAVLKPGSPFVAALVADLLWVNIGWGVLNLLPIVPLDGGRVLSAVLVRVTPGRAEQNAYLISTIVAFAAGAAALFFGMMFAALLGVLFGINNLNAYRQIRGGTASAAF